MTIDNFSPSQKQFDKDVANPSMTVIQDEGIRRHLRFDFKNGGFSWFEILTWRDRLVITGDCETFVFSRIEDMFEFFRSGGTRINPSYWQEKILDGRDRARTFDSNTFRVAALAAFDQATEEWDSEQRADARADLIGDIDDEPDEHGAANVLRNFQYTASDKTRFRFDLSDGFSDCKIWDYHYIWCCRAIVWAISQYDAHHGGARPGGRCKP